MATVAYAHIELTDEGVPVIAGTQTKMEQVVLESPGPTIGMRAKSTASIPTLAWPRFTALWPTTTTIRQKWIGKLRKDCAKSPKSERVSANTKIRLKLKAKGLLS